MKNKFIWQEMHSLLVYIHVFVHYIFCIVPNLIFSHVFRALCFIHLSRKISGYKNSVIKYIIYNLLTMR